MTAVLLNDKYLKRDHTKVDNDLYYFEFQHYFIAKRTPLQKHKKHLYLTI